MIERNGPTKSIDSFATIRNLSNVFSGLVILCPIQFGADYVICITAIVKDVIEIRWAASATKPFRVHAVEKRLKLVNANLIPTPISDPTTPTTVRVNPSANLNVAIFDAPNHRSRTFELSITSRHSKSKLVEPALAIAVSIVVACEHDGYCSHRIRSD
jgi:hypothetical protein